MSSSDDILARANAVLERSRVRGTLPNTVARGARRAARATKLGIGGAIAVLVGALIAGIFIPLGVTGILLTMLAMAAVLCLAVYFSAEPVVEAVALPKVALAQLPSKTESWLATQRPALPAPARTLADGIGVRLAGLSDQLRAVPDDTPAAGHVRRLLAEELPGLVEGYARVPATMRKDGIDGIQPDRELVDGLVAVDAELKRISDELARGHVEALATQGKYLEYKYRGDGIE